MIYISYFTVFIGLLLPLVLMVKRQDISATSLLAKLLFNLVINIVGILLAFKFIWKKWIFGPKSPFDLIFTVEFLITIIAIEALILAIDHWLHLSKWLTVISIEQLSAKSYLKALLAAIVAALTVFLTTASYWTTTTFGLLNPEQIIYNLKQPMEGADQRRVSCCHF